MGTSLFLHIKRKKRKEKSINTINQARRTEQWETGRETDWTLNMVTRHKFNILGWGLKPAAESVKQDKTYKKRNFKIEQEITEARHN